MVPHNAMYFRTSAEWREWLGRHHDKESEVWLVHVKKGSRKKGVGHLEAVEEALCYGWIDSKLRSKDEDTYVLRYSPRRRNSPWSETNRSSALRLIKEGRMTLAGLKKIDEAKSSGRWAAAYSSKREPAIPRDLRKALSKEPEALRNYLAMPNTRKLACVFWLEKAKKDTTRRERVASIVRKARSGEAGLP